MQDQQHEHQIVLTPPQAGIHPVIYAGLFLIGSFGSGAVVHQVAIPSLEHRVGQCEVATATNKAEIKGHDRRLNRIEARVYAKLPHQLANEIKLEPRLTNGEPGR